MDAEDAKEYEDSLMNRAAQRADRTNILMDTVIEMRPMNVPPPIQHTQHHITFDNTTVIPQHLIQPVVEPPKPKEPEAPPAPRHAAETPPAAPPPTSAAPVAPVQP